MSGVLVPAYRHYDRIRHRRVLVMSARRAMGCAAIAVITVMSAVAGAAVPRAAARESAPSTYRADGVVTIVWDAYGVPHVYARTARALFYGDGYATGRDRLWEAELLRLAATGTMAQQFGPGGGNVQSDLASRLYSGGEARLGILFHRMRATSRIAIDGYAEGLNAWIRRAEETGTLPPEY